MNDAKDPDENLGFLNPKSVLFSHWILYHCILKPYIPFFHFKISKYTSFVSIFFFLQGPQSATMHSLYNPYYPHFCFTQLLFLTYKSSIEANFLLMKSISKSSPNSKTLLTELFRRGIANIQV